MGKIAAHSAYDMFSWYKYLIVNLVFSHLGFWSGNLFLIAPFPDLCLLVSFQNVRLPSCKYTFVLNMNMSTTNQHTPAIILNENICSLNCLGHHPESTTTVASFTVPNSLHLLCPRKGNKLRLQHCYPVSDFLL